MFYVTIRLIDEWCIFLKLQVVKSTGIKSQGLKVRKNYILYIFLSYIIVSYIFLYCFLCTIFSKVAW